MIKLDVNQQDLDKIGGWEGYGNRVFSVAIPWLSAAVARELKQNAPQVTSQMANSVRPDVLSATEATVLFDSNYAWFVHEGRKPGKFPNFEDIRDWVRIKIKPDDVDSVAWAISHKIKRDGVKGNPWVAEFIRSPKAKTLSRKAVKRGLDAVANDA